MRLWWRFRRAGRGGGYAPERVSWPGLLLVSLVLFAMGFVYAYPRLRRPPLVERDFVGRVVDKSLTLRESEIGTSAHPRLLVEDGRGARFGVSVTAEQYERARAGMWVRRSGGEMELSWGGFEPRGGAKVGGR